MITASRRGSRGVAEEGEKAKRAEGREEAETRAKYARERERKGERREGMEKVKEE